MFTTKDGLFQNQIQDIQEDMLGNICFGIGGYGINLFDGKKFITLTLKDNLKLESNSKENRKFGLKDLWFNGGTGAFCYKDSLTYLNLASLETDLKYSPHSAYRSSAYGVFFIIASNLTS